MEQNKRMRILMCHNSTEGILCGVYEAFTSRYGHAYQKLAVGPYANGDLFSDIYSVNVDTGKAERVVKAIVSRISEEAWYMVHLAAESDSQEKGEIIYRFLILAFANGSRFSEWWKTFTESIAILERKNPRLQMQMLPKCYWKYMPEMEACAGGCRPST